MRSRTRSLTALVALLVLCLWQAEGAWASACAGEMGMAGPAGMVDAGEMEDCPMGEPGHSHESGGGEAPPCPLVPAGAASCIGGLAMPAAVDDRADPRPEISRAPVPTDRVKDLLLARTLLRPPRT